MKQKWVYKKKYLFYFVSPCFVMSIDQGFDLFHPVSGFSLYILFVSFVTKQKGVQRKRKTRNSICLFHFFPPCFIMNTDQGCILVEIKNASFLLE